ncbi:MAG: polysaccharide deacetylase family protein [Chloroflexi bacterium]|nr:polysaccharide deacetylase family protein [Chloroflexota bacterium]
MSATHPRIAKLTGLTGPRRACVTLDIEQDYGDLLAEPSYEGLGHLGDLAKFLGEQRIPVTCFIQGSLLETHPAQIRKLSSLDVDFELHSYSHPHPSRSKTRFEIEKGREIYRNFFGKDPSGYRAPLAVITAEGYEALASNNFKFDSSVSPSVRPGTFSNFRTPAAPYYLPDYKLVEFPFSVVSPLRIPLGISYIKLLGKIYLSFLKHAALPGLVIVAAHLHDLFPLKAAAKIDCRPFSPLYRYVFNRIYKDPTRDGLSLLATVIGILKRKDYAFTRLDRVYEGIRETWNKK